MFTAIISVVCLSNSQYAPVQALLWTGGAIWLHALAINLYLTRYLHLSFIYTTGGFPQKYSDIKESDNDPTIIHLAKWLFNGVYES